MLRKIAIEFPLPPKDLAQNASREGAWRKKTEARRIYRTTCANMAKQRKATLWKGVSFPLPCPVSIHIRFMNGRVNAGRPGWLPAMADTYCPVDVMNGIGAIKAIPDALTDAGVIHGDDHKMLRLGSVDILTTRPQHQGRFCVEITLEWEDGSDVAA